MFKCSLCENEFTIISSFCENCRVIKNIGNCYGYVEIKEILQRVCLRDGKQQDYKIRKEVSENLGDSSYIVKPEKNKKESKNN
tara:strand:+ start:2645 stop:2893 length:249 start_codon:yes stop_codon:yes gene_type:complete